MSRILIFLLLTALTACQESDPTAFLGPKSNPNPLCSQTLTPFAGLSAPFTMRVGDQIQFQIIFAPGNDNLSVVWNSANSSIAEWRAPQPPCANNQCAILAALSAGMTQVGYTVPDTGAPCGHGYVTLNVTLTVVN